jgi:uncharacterized SAM-binding protein YcdF (DUF218 family)
MNGFFKPMLFFVFVFSTSSVWGLVEKYVWKDSGFVLFLASLIACDTLLALLYHVTNGSFSYKKLMKVWIKVSVIIVVLSVTHSLRKFNVLNLENEVAKFLVEHLDYFSYHWVVMREILSINYYSSKFGYPLIPPVAEEKLVSFLRKVLKIKNLPKNFDVESS